MKPDLNEVAMFVHVVRAGSFVEAARRIGMPANSLSRRIGKLETQLGTRLLQRTTRKLSLTTAGLHFFERCSTSLDEVDLACQEQRASNDLPSGRIRVAAPADFLLMLKIERVEEFLKLYPDVRLELMMGDAPIDLVAEGIDIAFRAGRLPDSGLVARKINGNQAHLFASPAYLKVHGTPTQLQDLPNHRCLTHAHRAEHTRWVLEGPEGDEEVMVNGPLRANSIQPLLDATIIGLGVALLPDARAASAVNQGLLVKILPAYRRDLGGFYIVVPSRQQLPQAVTRFADFAQAALSADLKKMVD